MEAAEIPSEKPVDAEAGGPGASMSFWTFLRRAFPDSALEKLYLSYSVHQKREGLYCFLVAAVLYDFFYLMVPYEGATDFNWVMGAFFLINTTILLWCIFGLRACSPAWRALPYVCWVIFIAQVLLYLFLKVTEVTGRDNLGWVVVLDYLLYVLLPLRLRYCVLLSVSTCVLYLTAVGGLAKGENHLVEQVMGINNYIIKCPTAYESVEQLSQNHAYS